CARFGMGSPNFDYW
nr:immunoglobulin heavy chain junction region [Macaca mulatta]